jgi:hypothetical protein
MLSLALSTAHGMACHVRRSLAILVTLTLFGAAFLAASCAPQPRQEAGRVSTRVRPPTGIFRSDQPAPSTPVIRSPAGSLLYSALPLFTFQVATNGTCRVDCFEPDITQGIAGGGRFSYPGRELGIWQWNQQTLELILTVTNTSHMACAFPHALRLDELNPAHLVAVGLLTNFPPVFARSFHCRLE